MVAASARFANTEQATAVERYYRFHAGIYDLTRWTFLFGRKDILRRAASGGAPARILEVGCGTGRNLVELARLFPTSRIIGLDLSAAMLDQARKRTAAVAERVELRHGSYDAPLARTPTFDLVLFSYSLSMFEAGVEAAMDAALKDLKPGGCVAVVDFHDTPWGWFERWLGLNHVRASRRLRLLLRRHFSPLHDEVRPAYGGVWRYLMFLGRSG